MAIQSYLQNLPLNLFTTLTIFLLSSFCYFFFYYCWNLKYGRRIHSCLPTNWPVIGMLPGLILNAHRLHEYGTEILTESGGTFEFKGPWFANHDMVLTCDPANIHYILTKNFSNYPKGSQFRKIFDILGDGIFNADSELWEIHRKVTLSVMHNPDFQKLLEKAVSEKVEKGLLPILENCANRGAQVDLQDIFQRLTFDTISKLVLDWDPNSLSPCLPEIPCEKAFNHAVEALLQRHILPEPFWRLQKRVGFGKERKLSQAWEAFDHFIYPCIHRKQQQQKQRCIEEKSTAFDGLTAFTEAYRDAMKNSSTRITEQFLRDAVLNLMLAGRDTTSTALTWLFFLLAKHPSVEAKILREINETNEFHHFQRFRNNQQITTFNVEESRKLVYLHGALCETLRLYPPVALEHKSPINADVLPSGVAVNANAKLILFFYSMGRMESVWGKDCMEFKPERWISESGGGGRIGIRHEPSFKFPAFNAGPRTCLGKEMSFVQMKMVAASIICNYHVQLVEAHPVSPSDSIIIQMKHGLKVMLSKRIE